MGGVIPNKEDAITPGLLWTVSFPGGTTYDLADPTTFGGLTDRLSWRGQDNVVEFLKSTVKQFPEWVDAANQVFDGLRRGVPGGENVPLPLAIVEVFTGQLLGLPPGTWSDVNSAIAAIEGLPGIVELITVLTQAPGTILDYSTTLYTWASNLTSFFSGIDLNDPALNMVTALEAWVTANVLPYISVAISDVTGLAAALASLAPIDVIVNALGVAGSGFDQSALTSALMNIPGENLVSVAASIVTGVLSGSNIPGLDATKIVSGTLDQARAAWAAPIDTLIQAWGGTGSGYLATDLGNWASLIPFTSLQGTLGAPDLGTAIGDFVTSASRTLQNDTSLVNQTLGQFQNYFSGALAFLGWNPAGATPPSSVAAISSGTQTTLNNRAVQKDPNANIDRTMDATFDLKEVITQATLPTIAVTQNNPASAPINVRDGGQKQTIVFKGYTGSTGTLSGFYVNLYHVDPATGIWTWFYSTTDQKALLATGTTPQYNFVPIPALSYINTTAGDIIQAEINITGTATYNLVGKTLSNQLLPMTSVFPSMPAAQRQSVNAPTVVSVHNVFQGGNGGSGSITIDQSVSDTGAVFVCWMMRTTNAWPGGPVLAGVGMTSLGQDNYFLQPGVQSFGMGLYYMRNPPAGAQTISVGGNTGGTNTGVLAIQVANVGSIGTVTQNNATSANPSQAFPGGFANQLIIQGLSTTTTAYVSGVTGLDAAHSVYNTASGYAMGLGSVDGATAKTIGFVDGTASAWGLQWVAVGGLPSQPPPATVANPSAPGATGVAAAYSRLQPWIGLSGVAGMTQYSPITKTFAAGSGQSFNPSAWAPWANHIDVIQWPSGGSGAGGASGGGNGGGGSTPTVTTLSKAQVGTSAWTINVPSGPGASPPNTNGAAGSSASTVVPGYGTINATNVGAAGVGAVPSPYGQPGGGAAAASYTDANGTPVSFGGGPGGGSPQAGGGAPGGGGAGGNSPFYGSYTSGGPGGDGETILRAYQ